MSERLTASLEDGTLEKLRELAGGERKVGVYLSQLVAWLLWPHKEELDAAGPVGCVILRKDKLKNIPDAEAQAMWRATQQLQAESDRLMAELETVKAEARQQAQALRDVYARLMVRVVQLEQSSLPTQEDSSSNDA